MNAALHPRGDALADITPGFRDATRGAQQVFRTLLDAMSRPGRVMDWPAAALDGIVPPPGLGLGATAVLLALLDAETSLHLVGPAQAASAYLRFHTGVRARPQAQGAAFVAARAASLDAALCAQLDLGSDEAPQQGATLLVEVDALDAPPGAGPVWQLRGPGIETVHTLCVAGLADSVWHWRLGLEAERPRGVDLVFVHGRRVVALPRSTRLTQEG